MTDNLNSNDVSIATIKSIPKIVGRDCITLVIDGKTYAVSNTTRNFDKIKEFIKNPDNLVSDLLDLVDVKRSIKKFSYGNISVDENMNVLFGTYVLNNCLTKRMIAMIEDGFDVIPLANFLVNIMKNPSKTAVDELYEFLENNRLPITPDGHFLAYKRISDDFKDFHTNTFDNSVGTVLEMERNKVDDRRDNTCSDGFHFCSLEYLEHFHRNEGVIVIVKINPADVVSFPRDYNISKGRTCKYEVLSIYADYRPEKEAFTSPVETGVAAELSSDVKNIDDLKDVVSNLVAVFQELLKEKTK